MHHPSPTPQPDISYEQLRAGQIDEIDAICALWAQCGLLPVHHPEQGKTDIDNCLQSGRGSVIIARLPQHPSPGIKATAAIGHATDTPPITAGTIIATIMIGHDGQRGWVHYLAVHPALQGRGIGSGLLLLADDILRANTLAHCRITVVDPQLHGFYHRRGYHIIPAETHHAPLPVSSEPSGLHGPSSPPDDGVFVTMEKRLSI